MSNFKKTLQKVRENRKIKKIAAENIQPAQNTVEEDPDMAGYTAQIEEALKITIHPTVIDGYIETYSGELNITMSNGDDIQLKYDTDETTNMTTTELTINGQPQSLPPNFDPEQITAIYRKILETQ